MRSLTLELAAAGGDPIVGVGPLVVGIILVVGMIVARVHYARRKRREPPVEARPEPRAGAWPTRAEYGEPTAPGHGPGHQDGPPRP
jgi:hypothetical protein